MRKTAAIATLILELLFSAAVVTQFVSFGAANPYVFQGHVPPEDSTRSPSVTVTSPLNNTILDAHDVWIRLNASVPLSPKVHSIGFTYIYYEANWHEGNISLYDYRTDRPSWISEFKYSDLMKGMPEGNLSMVIHTEALGYYDADVIYSNGTTWISNHTLGIFTFDIGSISTVFFTIDRTPPKTSVLSIENKTYSDSDVTLNFTVSESTLNISYSLDGQENVTVAGNTTLAGLSNGAHDITVYATDFAGHTSASETIFFSVEVPPFPTALVATASGASVAIAGVGFLLYFKKRRKEATQT
jgi:hypothetical protein